MAREARTAAAPALDGPGVCRPLGRGTPGREEGERTPAFQRGRSPWPPLRWVRRRRPLVGEGRPLPEWPQSRPHQAGCGREMGHLGGLPSNLGTDLGAVSFVFVAQMTSDEETKAAGVFRKGRGR